MTFVPAPGYLPSYNPSLPFVTPVAGGLRPGMAIYVQGMVPHNADNFHVNLAINPDEMDLPLHLNPRFNSGVAVLNTRRGGYWEDEQRRDVHPLCRGEPFEIVISISPEGFRILVNGTFYTEFPHRLPPEQATVLTVDGDVELHSASVMSGAAACPPCISDMPQTIPSYSDCNLPVMEQPPILHPPVPFSTTIPGGLFPKKTIVIRGFVPHYNGRFHIDLVAGPDVVLHVNPRQDQGGVVVRNSFLGGSWGEEERDLSCCSPFQPGRYFDLSIRCGNHRFKVYAEGKPLFDYQHRVPAGPHVDVLEIAGDVVLSYVHF